MTLGAAQLVENQIARDFQQPRREFGARDISARAFPDPDKNLLRDVFYVRIAAQHPRHRARHQGLMPFNQFFERAGIALAHQPHEPHVLSVFLRSPLISWIASSHRSIRR